MITIPALAQLGSCARTAAPRRGRTVPPWAIVSAGLTPILLTGGWLVAGALQPASYSPIRDTVSVMAGHAGTDRWVMTGALLLVGGCHLVTAAGLGGIRVSARVLLILAGLSSIGIATSPEPIVGSTPQHLAWTSFGAAIITVWPAFAARPGSAQPLILSRRGSAVVTAVFIALLCWLVTETQGGSDLGMAERLISSVQTSWPFVVAVVLWRHTARARRPGLPGEPPEASPAQAMRTEAMTAQAMTAEAMKRGAMTAEAMTAGALRGERDLA
ncbi:MAG: hypothetical protein QOG05_2046 [Streptosporangiaceae bacterium]|nr:hypothetical protein [Streptosporangiaceae bacterium]